MQEMTLRQKILQMFILGFSQDDFRCNKYFADFIKEGLGGVIFFSCNIKSQSQFRELILSLKEKAFIEMFYGIDQEGGRVERTESIHNGKKYLSAGAAYKMGLSFLQSQTKEIVLELKSYGINMNFAPVLDVNTNENNPIIGDRAYSNKADEVIEAARVILDVYKNHKIIAVGKHFPGHGASSDDSHKTLPVINLAEEDLIQNHIRPFGSAIKMGIPAIMAAHVLYPSIDNSNLPASLSYNIITGLLRKELGFNGIIMTDDMEMNGVKGVPRLEACIKAINAGVDMFIFRDTTKDIYDLIDNLEHAVKNGQIREKRIDESIERILKIKYDYKIIR